MTVALITVLTIVSLSFGFHFGRSYEAERRSYEAERRRPKPPGGPVVDLHPREWERVA